MASRIKALEDMVKLGQMDEGTFVKLRDEIVGGDVGTTHLVKGLDWKLLERVRRGVDVLGGGEPGAKEEEEEQGQSGKGGEDVEEEFEKLEHQDVRPVEREERVKKGETAQAAVVAGKKRTRDEILAELRASRLVAAAEKKAAEKPSLGPKFRRLGDKKEKNRIERDGKGREVLITVDEEGRVKRKVKKFKVEEGTKSNGSGLLVPDKDAKPLGMEVQGVPLSEPAEDDDDGDIFEGAGDDYDPLGGGDNDDDDDSDGPSVEDTKTSPIDAEPASITHVEENETENAILDPPGSPRKESRSDMPPPPPPPRPWVPTRNYFGDPTANEPDSDIPTPSNPLTDPTILAALKKASSIAPIATEDSRDANDEEAARLARRKKMLESHDRDAEDMDLGFGSSRFEDEEDMEERKVKLSVWAGATEGGEDGGGKGDGKGKRKRGPKKRKGDGNNATDVLKVLKRRKEGSK